LRQRGKEKGDAFAFDTDKLGRFIHLSAPPVQAPPEPEEEEVVAEETAPAPAEVRRRHFKDEKVRLRAEGMLPEDPQALAVVVADPEASLAYRVAAGEESARQVDPRPGVGVDPETGRPALQWCLAPRAPS
jgi:hypothetical protein